MILRVLALFFVLSFVLSLPLSFASIYKRGNYICDDFEKAEEEYKKEPQEFILERVYAMCLLIRGDDDVQAINILESLAYKHNDVIAAFTLADYTVTGGTMDTTKLNGHNYDEALRAYGRVLLLIDRHANYPHPSFVASEWAGQRELEAYRSWVLIQYLRFNWAWFGLHNWHLLQSPSYKGDRNLNSWLKYNPYSIDSLKQTIEMAERCVSLPQKRHFQPLYYQQVRSFCRLIKTTAQTLLPLERERLDILNSGSCKDLLKCPDYLKVDDEMTAIIQETSKERFAIFEKIEAAPAAP